MVYAMRVKFVKNTYFNGVAYAIATCAIFSEENAKKLIKDGFAEEETCKLHEESFKPAEPSEPAPQPKKRGRPRKIKK